ncbi:LISK family protein kinase [Dictyostelium discoideum AX4]|uniref:Probable serine/threonine-protein kinase DDB_G0271538 n=1 Tax=Dictyostelium discoideum TaxID=44689 RepID=Y9853_DICDI|nr:LISK family protein kinase [Dictyostelium discoideum AX4]Q86AE1.1 RecName: Full=Probable serine/threonine-protein kinase DDB_G0271538 [Dictyostelium discoideum]EAL71633.1 LISK family protein kinase [Dictyostelium discoideum AX4]|eukprot:XP_645575.1 LISK family protein kinase [Dictyostelium discoideum AX4]
MNINFSKDDITGLPKSTKEEDENDFSSLDYSDLFMDVEIGRGSFGQVQKASYFGTDVAVKQLSTLVSIDPDYFKFMLREIKILKGMRHPNIVQYIGACCHEGRYMIVTEYIKGGDLHQFIKARGVSNISWTLRMKLALDIASAFSYLHSKKVIFRDLKAKNILVDEIGDGLYRAKVIDFGFARIFDGKDTNNLTICGSENTMSPEVIVGSSYNDSCDVYSYGVLLLELICGSRVVKTQLKRTPMNAFDMNLEKAEHLAPESCPRAFMDLAKWCCSYNPKDRPTFKIVVEGLKVLTNQQLKDLPVKGKSKPYIDPDEDSFIDPNDDSNNNNNSENNNNNNDNSNENNENNNENNNNSNENNNKKNKNGSGGDISGSSVIIKTDEEESFNSVVYKEHAVAQPLPNIDYGGQNKRQNNIFNPSFFTPPPNSKSMMDLKQSSAVDEDEDEDEDDVPSELLTSLTVNDIRYSNPKSFAATISTPNLNYATALDQDPPKPLSQSACATVLGGIPPMQPKKKPNNKNKKKKKKL